MNPFRTMQTAGFLKSLLDLLFWAIILLAPVYVVLVMLGYQRPGGADVFLAADVRFEPSPGDWALAGEGGRAAALVDGVGSVRFDRLPWPELGALLVASLLRVLLWLPVSTSCAGCSGRWAPAGRSCARTPAGCAASAGPCCWSSWP